MADKGKLESAIYKENVMEHPRNPYLAVDAIIEINGNKIILIERKFEPLGLALPGGFVEYGESCEDAVRREVMEETGLRFDIDRLVGVYSNPMRDPRKHVVSVAYSGKGYGIPLAGDDAKGIISEDIAELEIKAFRNTTDLVFDHWRILLDYLNIKFKERC